MKLTPAIAAALGAISVAMGAIGSHVVRGDDATAYQNWMTAVTFGLFHVLASIAASQRSGLNPLARIASIGFIVGVVCFSGSIWMKISWPPETNALSSMIGPAAPIGGMTLMASWALLAMSFLTSRSEN